MGIIRINWIIWMTYAEISDFSWGEISGFSWGEISDFNCARDLRCQRSPISVGWDLRFQLGRDISEFTWGEISDLSWGEISDFFFAFMFFSFSFYVFYNFFYFHVFYLIEFFLFSVVCFSIPSCSLSPPAWLFSIFGIIRQLPNLRLEFLYDLTLSQVPPKAIL